MPPNSSIHRFYKKPAFTPAKTSELLTKLQKIDENIVDLKTEICFYVEVTSEQLTVSEKKILKWVLQSPLEPENVTEEPALVTATGTLLIEVGPRFNFSTANSTNAVAICHSLGLKKVVRLEASRRHLIYFQKNAKVSSEEELLAQLHDRMTECRYVPEIIPKYSFNEKLTKKDDLHDVDVLGRGKEALREINAELGLAFDETDLEYYTNLFVNVLKRNPTSVECFDLAQSNSEHSRHWFFKGKMIVDGVEYDKSLIDMIIKTQETSNPNNVIKFSDNSRLAFNKKNYTQTNYSLFPLSVQSRATTIEA